MATKVPTGDRPRRANVREKFSTPDPIEIAMVAAASGKPLPDAARNVLEKHAKLIDRQSDLAQAQCAELKLRRVGEGVRAALWAILAISALAIVGLIAAVVVRASRSDALVVQSFRVPPHLAAKGLSGEVVATQVLDRLATMQASTQSARAASSYANNWEDELKIDIPNTGATTDQVWKLLRGWLGKETRISGEVIDTAKGLALTTRVGADPGQRFVSDGGDLDALIAQGAELIFRRTQPYRHAIYLSRDLKRSAERKALLQALTRDPSAAERKWAYNGLAVMYRREGNFGRSLEMASRALEIDPNMLPSLGNTSSAHIALGHDQAAVDANARERDTPLGEGYDPQITAANRCSQLAETGLLRSDPAQVEEAVRCLESSPESYADFAVNVRLDASWLRRNAEPLLAFHQVSSEAVPEADATAVTALYRLRGEMLKGRSSALAEALREYAAAAYAQQAAPGLFAGYNRATQPTLVWPLQAEAMLVLGRNAEAAALISKTPRDCYTCVRVRGMVAQANGKSVDAQRWLREAIRQGPRLAPAYVDYARLLAANRRWAGAERHFAQATELSPSWGDPLKYWADALAAQGKRTEALAKYDAALKLSPSWAALRKTRNRAARR
jgi:tetratricopeptide (TPR) repeat protein